MKIQMLAESCIIRVTLISVREQGASFFFKETYSHTKEMAAGLS